MAIQIDLHKNKSFFHQLKKDGKKIGLCHGVFDLVHPGHISHFEIARKYVDTLVVSLTKDEFVNKGPGRPYFMIDERIRFLKNITLIDFIVVSDLDSAVDVIEKVLPDYYFKGNEYKNARDDLSGNMDAEKNAVNRIGGRTLYTNGFTSSSSYLINREFTKFTEETEKWLNTFRKNISIEEIYESLEKITKLKVVLIGESILDRYTEVVPLAKTGKDPILAFHIQNSETFPGGVLAIADNLSNLVERVDVISSCKESEIDIYLKKFLPNVNYFAVSDTSLPITKHRFIDRGSNQKLFETYDFDPNYFLNEDISDFLPLNLLHQSDLVMVADYGHGLLDSKTISKISQNSTYLAVNVQANAGNRGFNTLEKYNSANFFTANSGELQIQSRSICPDFHLLMRTLMISKGSSCAIMTDGERGLTVFSENNACTAPALAGKVVDKVGAGDSVFAISSLLAKVSTRVEIIGFLSNLIAANEISTKGHSSSLNLNRLKKQIKSVLA